MIDLYFAEFHIELIEAEGGKLVTVDCAMMRELITRLRQAEKDAARYRWLRDESSNSERTSPLVFMADECADIVTEGWYQGIMFGEFLDCAMDEAMQCNK